MVANVVFIPKKLKKKVGGEASDLSVKNYSSESLTGGPATQHSFVEP